MRRMPRALIVSAVMASAVSRPALADERVKGEVALSAPQCAFLVVQTSHGYSLLELQHYYGVLEGDEVRGLLHSPGAHEVELVGEAALPVSIEDWGLPLRQAARVFYRRCHIAPDARDEEVAAPAWDQWGAYPSLLNVRRR
jgi:hypothetical protein